jgi:hypothetical protein
MSTPTRITIPVASFRHLETPFLNRGYRDYFAVVDIRELPDLSQWRKINVRDPKLTGTVPDHIRGSVNEQPELFVFMNRGLVLSIDDAEFDAKASAVTVTLKDPKIHGLLDGGHTYNILLEERAALQEPQYVRVEFLQGFRAEEVPNIVDARNTSNQVRDQSLMNLKGDFGPLQEALAGSRFEKLIAYSEYELGEDGEPKPIDVRDVISILTCFDREHFDANSHPVVAYSSKAQCLKHFKAHRDSYRRIYPIARQLLELHDLVHLHLPELYNVARKERDGVSSGRFGGLTGVTSYQTPKVLLRFLGEKSTYAIPAGFIYPVLAGFRAMLSERGGAYAWASPVDPQIAIKGELGRTLAYRVGSFALEMQNPNKTGKTALVWSSCYEACENALLRQSAQR